jgi:hypothetical protein
MELDGRTREISLPILSVSDDVEFYDQFYSYMEQRSRVLRQDDPVRIILEAFLSRTKIGNQFIQLRQVALDAMTIGKDREIPDYFFSTKKVGDILRGLQFKTVRWGSGSIIYPDLRLLDKQCRRFHVGSDDGDVSDAERATVMKNAA